MGGDVLRVSKGGLLEYEAFLLADGGTGGVLVSSELPKTTSESVNGSKLNGKSVKFASFRSLPLGIGISRGVSKEECLL